MQVVWSADFCRVNARISKAGIPESVARQDAAEQCLQASGLQILQLLTVKPDLFCLKFGHAGTSIWGTEREEFGALTGIISGRGSRDKSTGARRHLVGKSGPFGWGGWRLFAVLGGFSVQLNSAELGINVFGTPGFPAVSDTEFPGNLIECSPGPGRAATLQALNVPERLPEFTTCRQCLPR